MLLHFLYTKSKIGERVKTMCSVRKLTLHFRPQGRPKDVRAGVRFLVQQMIRKDALEKGEQFWYYLNISEEYV